jgi:signal peptidase
MSVPILARVNASQPPSRGRGQPASKAAKPAAKAKAKANSAAAKAPAKAATRGVTASSRAAAPAPAKKVAKAAPKAPARAIKAKAPAARRAAPARAATPIAPVEPVETTPAAPPTDTVEELRTRLQSLEAQLATKGAEAPAPPATEPTAQVAANAGWAPPPGPGDRASGWRLPGPSWVGTTARWVVTVAAGLVVLGLLIVSVGPKFLPYQALVVRSGSMSPTIPTGSIVFYHKEAASQVKVGQIIVFAEPNNPNIKVTHRVYRIGSGSSGRYFITKGDANGTPDNWQVPAVGTGWVAGFHVADVGYFLADLQSTTARFLLLVIPAVALGGIALYETWKPRREHADEGAAA